MAYLLKAVISIDTSIYTDSTCSKGLFKLIDSFERIMLSRVVQSLVCVSSLVIQIRNCGYKEVFINICSYNQLRITSFTQQKLVLDDLTDRHTLTCLPVLFTINHPIHILSPLRHIPHHFLISCTKSSSI